MKSLTIIIPFYNERQRLPATLKQLQKLPAFPHLNITQIIFVNDGSTDNGPSFLKNKLPILMSCLKIPVNLVSYPCNLGRGFAIRYAVNFADTDYVVYTDADFSISLDNLHQFIPYLEKNTDLLYASKKIPGNINLAPRSLARKFVGYSHSFIVSTILGIFSWDYQGGFKIFSRRLIDNIFPILSINRWGFDMEIIFLAKKLGFSTHEIPVTWHHIQAHSKVRLWRDSIQALKDAFYIKKSWLQSNYVPTKLSPTISKICP